MRDVAQCFVFAIAIELLRATVPALYVAIEPPHDDGIKGEPPASSAFTASMRAQN
jgi:hypothetical protein